MSGDVFYIMPQGFVLSITLNMLGDLPHNKWGEYLDAVKSEHYPDIQIKKELNFDRLSAKDKSYIENISEKFKKYTPRQFEDYMHSLPEWIDPKGSSLKIRYRDVMLALGKSAEEISAAKQEQEKIHELFCIGA